MRTKPQMKLVSTCTWQALMRSVARVQLESRSNSDWVGQREAQRLAKITARTLQQAREAGRIATVRVGNEKPIWLYWAPDCRNYKKIGHRPRTQDWLPKPLPRPLSPSNDGNESLSDSDDTDL